MLVKLGIVVERAALEYRERRRAGRDCDVLLAFCHDASTDALVIRYVFFHGDRQIWSRLQLTHCFTHDAGPIPGRYDRQILRRRRLLRFMLAAEALPIAFF
jgi:hypothetical protein